MADVAWSAFKHALVREMGRTKPALTAKELELRLLARGLTTISEERISNWRRGLSRPKLVELGVIVDALNHERPDDRARPFSMQTLLEDMGVVTLGPSSQELFGRAYRLHKINLKLEGADTALATTGRRAGAARIVQQAIDTQEWAVAVTPALEGPDENTQMHVADRLTIVRVGGQPLFDDPDADIWADKHMKAAIRSTYALPSEAGGRWSTPPPDAVAPPTRWSISYVSSPRDAVVSVPWEGLRAFAVIATTQTSWVKNVASLVSLALGYGLTTTSDLAMVATGRSTDKTSHRDRAQSHQLLLDRLPARRVWAHYGIPSPGDSVFGPLPTESGGAPRFVWLDESDRQLRRAEREAAFDDLVVAREHYRAAALDRTSTVLRLPAEYRESRSTRWEQVFMHSLTVLDWLRDPDSGISMPTQKLRKVHDQVKAREAAVALPFFDWLERHGWPD
jgi:hypothetical protein